MRARAYRRFAWFVCGYLLFVILFGAWVRITHSGAGCGSHWPTCHGEIVPLDPSAETLIEYTHRLTSGVLGILGLVLVLAVPRGPGSRRVLAAAGVTLAFIVVEALIGAGLVLRALVEDDDSVARAIVIALHLVNTLVLSGAAALTAWWSDARPPLSWSRARTFSMAGLGRGVWLVLALASLVLASMAGAVTALGDTLFPVDPQHPLLERVRGELSPASHVLVRLRVAHPMLAVTAAALVLGVARWLREDPRTDATTRRLAAALRHAVVVQVVIGLANIGLAAPGWLQLVHLLAAEVVWIVAVLTAVSAASPPDAATLREMDYPSNTP